MPSWIIAFPLVALAVQSPVTVSRSGRDGVVESGDPAVTTSAARAAAVITGLIRDLETGAGLANADVTLRENGMRAVTDVDGRYELLAVQPGPYHLEIERLGYVSQTVHVFVPRAGRLEVGVSLRPEPVRLDRLTVRRAIPVRGIDADDHAPFPDRGLGAAALRSHPTLPQTDAFLALAGGEVVIEPESPVGVHIRGGATDHTAYVLDGVPILNPYHVAGLFSAWNPDALSDIRLIAAAPSPSLPSALSGVIAASTLDPGDRFELRSAMSNVEGRVAVSGPLGLASAGYLVSLRSGFPALLAPRNEPSYLGGETSDLVAKLTAALAGGTLRVLAYDSENEIGAASGVADANNAGAVPPRNQFNWLSRSTGVQWGREWDAVGIRAAAWRSQSDARAAWSSHDAQVGLSSARDDRGAEISARVKATATTTDAGLRVTRLATTYRIDAVNAGTVLDSEEAIHVAELYAGHEARYGPVRAWAGASASFAAGSKYLSPRAELSWRLSDAWTWTLSAARTQQFAQSLRNAESVVGHVFPADLFVVAGAGGVPVPRSDQIVVAGEWRPTPGFRLGAQAYTRAMDDVLLVAAHDLGPFAMRASTSDGDATSRPSVEAGSASASGAALDLAASGARYGVVASYGWQRLRFRHADSAYVPSHGTSHVVEAGIVAFPTPTTALRLAVDVRAGRTTTAVAGPFEWESCNLVDQGCEFAGSPSLAGNPGSVELPTYLRVDIGGRKHWHVRAGGRDLVIGAFATVSNVFSRGNLLTYVIDPDTAGSAGITMTPRSPLVVGIDVRF